MNRFHPYEFCWKVTSIVAVLGLTAPRVPVGVPAANRARCPSAPNLHHSSHTHYQMCPLSSHVKTKIPMAKMDFMGFLFCFTMSGQVPICWVFFWWCY